jgi:hypothetical protein
MPNTVRASGEAMPKINRRRFLLNTTMAGAAVAVAAPVAAAELEMTPHEQAIWHLRELERLAIEAGAQKVTLAVIAHMEPTSDPSFKMMMVDWKGGLRDDDGLFAPRGGAA